MKKKPLILGVTGSIGMGKSTVSNILEREGFPLFCADKIVHALMEPEGKAFLKIKKRFPETIGKNGIDRKKLGQVIFQCPEKREGLERILHPMVWKERKDFLQNAAKNGHKMVVLDIPLLFETGADAFCDVTLCVTAKKSVQKARVLARRGMTKEKLKAILSSQMPDSEKRKKADIVLRSDIPKKEMKQKLLQHINALLSQRDQKNAS